jgi:hypothetical protein
MNSVPEKGIDIDPPHRDLRKGRGEGRREEGEGDE